MDTNFKSYAKICFFACSVLLIVVAVTNYLVDPANIYGNKNYEKKIAKLLVEGKNVANISNYDERLLQKYYIENINKPIDVVVLGSSRSMITSSKNFKGESFFNNSVSGATVEDYLAIYELYVIRGFIPKTIVIGAEPWILNKNNGHNRWESLKEYYFLIAERLHINKPRLKSTLEEDKIAQLINFDYLMKSIKSLFKDRNIHATSDREADMQIKLADGSISYNKSFREAPPIETRRLAAEYANANPVYGLGGFKELDQYQREILEKFIDNLKKDGVGVILFLPPYNPTTYEILMKREEYNDMLKNAEAYFYDLAILKGIRIIGSYNPQGLCTQEEFYDGMHPKESCIDRLFFSLGQLQSKQERLVHNPPTPQPLPEAVRINPPGKDEEQSLKPLH